MCAGVKFLIRREILAFRRECEHRQSKEWTGNTGKIANVADATSVMRPDMLYFGTRYLYFKYISRLCIYKF